MAVTDPVSSEPKLSHPAFRSFVQVIPLSGFSGAEVVLLRDTDGTHFVRKASKSVADNKALQVQSARQARLRHQLMGVAQVPEVLCEGTIDDLYYFDMSFVPSSDATTFLSRASFSEVSLFAERVEDMMRQLSSMHDPSAKAPRYLALVEKVEEIDAKTAGAFSQLLEPLHDCFSRLKACSCPPRATIVHGDLTFENVLVDSNYGLWLIDSIQPPFEHYWMDWSKLFQESEGLWHRHRGNSLSTGMMTWLLERWRKTANEVSADYSRLHYPLLALTFARILPYARTAEDKTFLAKRIASFGQAAQTSLENLP